MCPQSKAVLISLTICETPFIIFSLLFKLFSITLIIELPTTTASECFEINLALSALLIPKPTAKGIFESSFIFF